MIVASRPLTFIRANNFEKWPNSYVIFPFLSLRNVRVELIDFREIIAHYTLRISIHLFLGSIKIVLVKK